MIKIGNIIYNTNLVNHTKLDYINYIKWDDGIEYDHTIPTLIVGWTLLKSLYPTTLETILNKEINENSLYWEYSFEERKEDHVLGTEMFGRNVPYYFFRKNFKYINLDPIFYNINSIDDLKDKLPKHLESMYCIKNNMLYILSKDEVYGVDLIIYSYFNIEKEEILNYLKSMTSKFFNDEEGSIYLKYYKRYPNFEELKRYLVVLLSKS